jgi:uncharacterized protein (UPF0332 family)
LPDERRVDLCNYRMKNSEDSLTVAEDCLKKGLYRDAINRSFYAIKALLALEEVDFKKHKDVVAYFNRTYAATEKIPREIGRKLARLQQKREKSDYDDFYITSLSSLRITPEPLVSLIYTKSVILAVKDYLSRMEN